LCLSDFCLTFGQNIFMKKNEISISVSEFENLDELAKGDRDIFKQAQKSILTAYAPYSKFAVGAAVLLENGKVVNGSNQENMAYPSGLCAERVALLAARSNYPDQKVIALAVSTTDSDVKTSLLTPCGACRQVIHEVEEDQISGMRIICGSGKGPILVFENGDQLLPFSFSQPTLKTI